MSDVLSILTLDRVLLPGQHMRFPAHGASHVKMISDCQRNGITFGCCFDAHRVDERHPVGPTSVGTEALISDFGTMPDGTLFFRLLGHRRFRIRRLLLEHDALHVAEVEWFAPEPNDRLLHEHGIFGFVLQHRFEAEVDMHQPLRAEFDHAASVSWQIIHLLNAPMEMQQRLLEMPDPHQRLSWLKSWYKDKMAQEDAAAAGSSSS
jgi:uncharacterized protein